MAHSNTLYFKGKEWDRMELLKHLAPQYIKLDKADYFNIAFYEQGRCYCGIFKEFTPTDLVALFRVQIGGTDRKGNTYLRLKYEQTTAKIRYIKNNANEIIDLCTRAELQATAKTLQNKTEGDACEYLLCEYLGGAMSVASLPSWQGGDFSVNGIQIQSKTPKASIIIYTDKYN